mgnify:CR=1 FL=1
MFFHYKAKLNNGSITEGVLDARDRFALAKDLRSRGITPISISQSQNSFDFLKSIENLLAKVSIDEKIIFIKNLSGMLKAGLPLSRCISVLEKQTTNPLMKKIFVSLSEGVNKGESLSVNLAKYPNVFSGLFVSMVRAGEESGNLSGALNDVSVNLEKSASLSKKVKGALVYPGVILSAMLVIGILMFAFVVPTLAGTFKELGIKLPLSTQAIIFMGEFFSNHLILTFFLLLIGFSAILALLRAQFFAKYLDFVIIKLPVIGTLVQEINTARTARTMASLLFSGVSITHAVEITEEVVQNVYYKKVLADSRSFIEHGQPFSEAFRVRTDLYPIMMSEMIQVGEETGKLSDMLLNIATFYEEEVDNKTKNLSTIVEPLLMVFIGSGVGFFAISMISPMYSILGSIE